MEQIQKKRSLVLTRKGVTRLHLMLSASLVSFLLAYYYYNYDFWSVLPNYIEHAYYPIELLQSQGMDKLYVFLVFNGILLVLGKTAGSLISQSSFDLKEHIYVKNIHDALHTQYEDDMEDNELVIRVDGSDKDVKFVTENVGETIEELNKKFDEFIRKKKEEIRADANQHVTFPYD